jgi:hypothetical protein
MKLQQRSEIPEFIRRLVILLSGVLGVGGGLIFGSMQTFNWPNLEIDEKKIWVGFSAIAIATLLPLAVFISLKRTASDNRDDGDDPEQSKRETRGYLRASTIAAAVCATVAILWAREQSVGLNKIVFDIAVSLPALALVIADVFFNRLYGHINTFESRPVSDMDAENGKRMLRSKRSAAKRKPKRAPMRK